MDAAELSTDQIKSALIKSAASFKKAQEDLWKAEDSAAAIEASERASSQVDERVKSPLQAEAFGNVEIGGDETLGRRKNETIDLILALAERNPFEQPLKGWREEDGRRRCLLDGTWELLFTTGADATFRPKAGETARPVAYQEIDAAKGYFVNCVDFPDPTAPGQGQGEAAPAPSPSKLKGFRVVVAGYALNDFEMQLKFRRVKLLRRSRWLKTLMLPLPPSGLLRRISRWASRGKGQPSDRGAGFKLLYLDQDFRMHLTFDGQYFVQRRIR